MHIACLAIHIDFLPIPAFTDNSVTHFVWLDFLFLVASRSKLSLVFAGPPVSWINTGCGGSGQLELPGVWWNVTTERSWGRCGLDLLDHSVILPLLKVRAETDLGRETVHAHILAHSHTCSTRTPIQSHTRSGSSHIPAVQLGGKKRRWRWRGTHVTQVRGPDQCLWRSP